MAAGCLATLLMGCGERPAVPSQTPQSRSVVAIAGNATAPADANATVSRGVVAHVPAALGVCVVEFHEPALPSAGSALWVYRADQRVAELVVQEGREQGFVLAEIRTGEPQAGDEVRVASRK